MPGPSYRRIAAFISAPLARLSKWVRQARMRARIVQTLPTLPELQRSVFQHHCVDGHPLAVTALALGLTREQAEDALAEALVTLAAAIPPRAS